MRAFTDYPLQKTQSGNDFLQLIQAEIMHENVCSFADYMRFALYHPRLGFYNTQDYLAHFTTAPHISTLFGKCLAKQITEVFKVTKKNTLLEFGAGSGKLAQDIVLSLQQSQSLPNNYFIIELSPLLRIRQQDYLQKMLPEHFDLFTWIDTIPQDFCGVIIANEVLDAMPVHCFEIANNMIYERTVAVQDNELIWTQRDNPELKTVVSELHSKFNFTPGYQSEINLGLKNFIQYIADACQEAVILFIDYGYGEREYYHPERSNGSLTCFHFQQKNNDPLTRPALQDITAHVDFTRVAECTLNADLDVLGYTSQAAFLLACGLLDFAKLEEENLSVSEQVNLHTAIKLLTLPTEMGERIKVMALGKNINLDMLGFKLQDRRFDL